MKQNRAWIIFAYLGLTTSKEPTAVLVGSIGMESEAGKGSTFWLDILVTLAKEKG